MNSFIFPIGSLSTAGFIALGAVLGVALTPMLRAQQTDNTLIAWGGVATNLAADAVSVACGYGDILLLKRDGSVAQHGTAWPGLDPLKPAPNLSNCIGIAAAWNRNFALQHDGTVVFWDINSGKAEPVLGLTNIVAISGSIYSGLALNADGTVQTFNNSNTNVPPGLTNVVAVTAGSGYLALRADGGVVGWGWPWTLTNGISELTNVVAVSAGWEEWMALKSDGTVVGKGTYGSPPVLLDIQAIASSSGNDHHLSMALQADGSVRAWGFNFYAGSQPLVPAGLTKAVAIAAGGGHNVALIGGGPPFLTSPLVDRSAHTGGQVHFRIEACGAWPLTYQWQFNGTDIVGATNPVLSLAAVGTNQQGQYSVNVRNALGFAASRAATLSVVPIHFLTPPQHCVTYTGGAAGFSVVAQGIEPLVYKWQHNGEDIPGATESVLALSNVQFSAAGEYAVIVTNEFGEAISCKARLTVMPVLIKGEPQDQVTYVGGPATFAVQVSGEEPIHYQWELNGTAIEAATNAVLTITNTQPSFSGTASVTVSNRHGTIRSRLARLTVGKVASWGIWDRNSVSPEAANSMALRIAGRSIFGLTADGNWVGWGWKEVWPLGLDLSRTIDVRGQDSFLVTLQDDGTVKIWGNDLYATNVPPDVTNVVAVSSQYSHAIALRSDGTVVGWGHNYAGVSTVPTGLADIVAVSAGAYHNVVLKSDGTIAVWGDNQFGQTNAPSAITDAVAIAAGWWHNLVLRANGTVVGFGYDEYGQASPPSGLSNVVAIACGNFHSLALIADGRVVAWGYGSIVKPDSSQYGQSIVPTDLTNVVAIAAGDYFSLALIGEGPPVQQVSVEHPIWDADGFRVQVPTHVGRVFRLEYKHSLHDGQWIPLPLVAGTGRVQTLKDSTAHGALQRFYRIRRW